VVSAPGCVHMAFEPDEVPCRTPEGHVRWEEGAECGYGKGRLFVFLSVKDFNFIASFCISK